MKGTVRKRGDSWQALLTVVDTATNKHRQLSSTHKTKGDAEHWLAVTASRHGQGKGAAHSMTVAELLETWFDQKAPDWSPSNRRNTRNAIDRVIVPRFGPTPVMKLRASDLDQWYATLRRRLNPSTIRKYHNIVHAAYKMAERYDWVLANPAGKASPPRIVRKPIEVPTRDQVIDLLESCDGHDPRLGFGVYLAAHTGMRRGEILGLRWSDFDPVGLRLRIWNAVIIGEGDVPVLKKGTKTGTERSISLDASVFERLARHREWCEENARAARTRVRDTSFVFSNEVDCSRPMSPDYFSMMYEKARRKVGLQGLRLHDLRHYHVTYLLAEGEAVRTVAGRVGHAGGGRMTLEVYGHFIPDADRRAAERTADNLRRTG